MGIRSKLKVSSPTDNLFLLLGFVIVFAGWWVFSLIKQGQGYNPGLFPDPWTVVVRVGQELVSPRVWSAIGGTMLRLVIGFGISFIAALTFGLAGGIWKPVRLMLTPIVRIMRSAPTAAVAFLMLVVFSKTWTPAALIFLVAFPIIYESLVKGIQEIDTDVLDAAKLDTELHSRFGLFGVIVPMVSPYVALSVATSLGLSMKVSIMGEIVAGGESTNGLGRLIYIANQIDIDFVEVFALSLIAIFIILIFDSVLFIIKKHLSR